MRFLFIYHAGQVPESDQEENIRLLWDWLDNLKAAGIEKSRFVGEGIQEILLASPSLSVPLLMKRLI